MGCEVDGRFFTWKIFFPQKLIGPYFTFFANTCPPWIWSYLVVKFFTTWTVHPHISGHRKSKRLFPCAEVSACSKHNHFHFKRMQDSKGKCMKMHENFKNCGGKKITFWTAEFEQPNNNLFAEFRGEFSQVVSHGTHIRFPRYWGYTKRDTPPREVRPRMVRRAGGWFHRELSTNKFLKIGLYPREAPKSLLRCS